MAFVEENCFNSCEGCAVPLRVLRFRIERFSRSLDCLDCRGFLSGFNVSRCHAPISRPGIVIALTRVKGGTTGFYCDSDSVRRSNFETNRRTSGTKLRNSFSKESFSSIVFFPKFKSRQEIFRPMKNLRRISDKETNSDQIN